MGEETSVAAEKFDWLEEIQDKIYTCNRTRCGFCTHVCPIYEMLRLESYAARGRMLILRSILEGTLTIDDPEVREILSRCTLCGACEENCALQNTDIWARARQEMIQRGLTVKNVEIAVKSILSDKSNPMLQEKEAKRKWTKKLEVPLPKQAEVLFYTGCQYPLLFPEELRRWLELFPNPPMILEEEVCCGALLYESGHIEEFKAQASKVKSQLEGTGAKIVVSACPGCVKTLTEDYERVGVKLSLPVYHMVQFLVEHSIKGVHRPANDEVYTYFDPCHLSRFLQQDEAPRQLIKATGVKFVETYYEPDAHCCGGGGGLLSADGDLALDLAKLRLEEAQQVGATTLITSCPTCLTTLQRAARIHRLPIKVVDLVDFLLNKPPYEDFEELFD